MILALAGALAGVGLILLIWLGANERQRNGAPAVDGPDAQPPVEKAEPHDGPREAPPTPGRYLLLLTDDVGLTGRLDERLVFHGEEIYFLGPSYSGAPFLDRRHVKKIIWPEGVDPKKYPAKEKE